MKTGNEIIDDCKWFADKHRGKNKQSGPNWSTIIRFPELYDEAVRLENRVETLEAYIADYCTQTIKALESRVKTLETYIEDLPALEESRTVVEYSEFEKIKQNMSKQEYERLYLSDWQKDCSV